MTMNRRQFLRALSLGTAAAAAPWGTAVPAFAGPAGARAAAELTTLAQTLRPGPKASSGYRKVATGPGEPHVVREDIAKAKAGRAASRKSLLAFVHLTDHHIIDVQSPTRVEFLDRYSDSNCDPLPFSSAYRAHEAASARIADAMLRRVRRVGVSPVTGVPFAAAIATGDNTDNRQLNELEFFMAIMDGRRVHPNSGDPTRYEGVQASGDLSYWHPDPAVNDFYKQRHGFPSKKGWLEDALASFDAVGTGIPWYTCNGNHDGLAQGNAPVNPGMERIGTGGTKTIGLPPGANPCEEFENVGLPTAGPTMPTTPDSGRRYLSHQEWIQRHFRGNGRPVGHGFTQHNVDNSLAYYATDIGPLRFLVLDTVNPGGYDDGSIGEAQLAWLVEQLRKAQDQRRMVLLFSHHGLRSLDNPNQAPDPLSPDTTDLPRRGSGDVLEAIKPFSCVIAWVNGHSHENTIEPRSTFWDIGTAAHIDWPMQSRILDVVDNRDGTLSIFTTMVDHEDDRIASFARELALNDHQRTPAQGAGAVQDRNTELLLAHPFSGSGGSGGDGGTGGSGGPGGDGGIKGVGGGVTLPTTGSGIQAGGALAIAAAAGLLRLRQR
jgi:metallophosphoesterase (TIGR03767 family)